jgi:hypothetical protein
MSPRIRRPGNDRGVRQSPRVRRRRQGRAGAPSSTKRSQLPVARAIRAFEAELHRARGEILLKQNPANPAPAEDAYRTSIAIAKQQEARSYELLASLSLTRLYRLTDRPSDAHAILAPALEGFFPTPEMPEIAEAQALLVLSRPARM